ncbi:MAG: adenylyl-sulfate kinase [Euzebya sp.]
MTANPDGPAGVSQMVDPPTAARIRVDSADWPNLVLEAESLRSLELIATGAVAPLRTFMTKEQVRDVALGRPVHGTKWPSPVTLSVSAAATTGVEVGQTVALRSAEGDLLASLMVQQIWQQEPATARRSSHGVCLSGGLSIVALPVHYDFAELRLSPQDFRTAYGQPQVVVTDRPPDAVQLKQWDDDVHVLALDSGQAVGQLDAVTLVRALHAAGAASVTLIPRPPGADARAWAPVLAQGYGVSLRPDPNSSAIDDVALSDALTVGELPGPDVFTPAVLQVLQHRFPPRQTVGFTVLFTGLSGSGKSTVANALAVRLQSLGPRRVTLLDGDLVRRHLSSELSFSREHRDLNVTRIGFVAAEVTRHGGIAICAPIAPYAATRHRVRDMISALGRYILVHVATPLEVCEARDRKGLYAKARAGLIPQFTGISDPYEVPDDADIVLDTTFLRPREAAAQVEAYLGKLGLVRGSS